MIYYVFVSCVFAVACCVVFWMFIVSSYLREIHTMLKMFTGYRLPEMKEYVRDPNSKHISGGEYIKEHNYVHDS